MGLLDFIFELNDDIEEGEFIPLKVFNAVIIHQ